LTDADGASPPRCHRCARALAAGEGGPVRLFFRCVAGFSLAPVHAGMWLWEDLSRDHCPPCRRWLSFLSLVLGFLVLGLALWGLRWARRVGIF
jgi:hypothetical protein